MNSRDVGSRSAQRARRLVAVAMLVVPCVAGAADPATKPAYGAASPQALVDRLNAAIASKDFAALVNCMDADGRVEASAGMLALSVMMVAIPDLADATDDMSPEIAAALTPEQKAALDGERKKTRDRELGTVRTRLAAILKRHKLPDFTKPGLALPQGEKRTKLLAALDHGALVRDLVGFMDAPGADPVDLPLSEQVRNLKVSGNRATATAGKETLALREQTGRWYLVATDRMGTDKP